MTAERIAAAIEALAELADAGFTAYYEGGACLRVWHAHTMRYVAIESLETAEDACLYVRDVFA